MRNWWCKWNIFSWNSWKKFLKKILPYDMIALFRSASSWYWNNIFESKPDSKCFDLASFLEGCKFGFGKEWSIWSSIFQILVSFSKKFLKSFFFDSFSYLVFYRTFNYFLSKSFDIRKVDLLYFFSSENICKKNSPVNSST